MAKRWWEIPAVILLLLGLALVSTYPLIRHFDTGIPYAPFGGGEVWNRSGDQIQLLYWFWLVKENFMGTVPFNTNPYEFNMLVPHESSGLNTVPLAFIYMLFSPLGDIAAYNCTILSSYILAGVFMYLLIYLYTSSRVGALLGAIIFTFAPSRINGFTAGHGYGFLFFFYPFILYFLEKGIRSKKIRYGVISGLGLIGLSMLEPHLIYYMSVFLGVFIPIRILALFPVQEGNLSSHEVFSRGIYSWSVLRSCITLWAAGVVTVVYTQLLFVYRDLDPFFTSSFWWIVGIYPFIPVLFGFCCAAVYQRLACLSFRESLAVEAGSFLPMFLLLPLSMVSFSKQPLETGFLVATALVLVVGMKLVLLRHHLLSMLKVLAGEVWKNKRKILPILPLIFSMGFIVVRITGRTKQIDSTIAAGGRTLSDVKIFSSSLSDIFLSTSNLYIGIVPAILFGGLLLVFLWSLFVKRPRGVFNKESGFITLFYVVVAFFCFLLALGLALGKSSVYVLFYHYFPFFHYPRVSDRFITMVLFALAIVVGFAVKWLQQRCKRQVTFAVVSSVVLAGTGLQLLDYNTFKPMAINILDKGQDIYTHVEKNVGDGLLLEIPLWPGDSHQSSLYQHYIMLDRVKRVNGCSPLVLNEYIDTVFEPLVGINRGRLDRRQFDLLHELDVKFITVHDNRDIFLHKVSPFEPLVTVRRLKNSPFLEFVEVDNSMHSKTWSKKNKRLYLFKVKDKEAVKEPYEKAWYDMPTYYDMYNRLKYQTGKIIDDKEAGGKVFYATADSDKPGFMVYGPYVHYPPGNYRCYFTFSASDTKQDNIARLEVSSYNRNGEVVVHAQTVVTGEEGDGSYKKAFLDFSLDQKENMEFRVFFYGKGQISVKNIVVYKLDEDKPLHLLEAEKMVGYTGQLVFDEVASGGKVIEVSKQKAITKDIVYGPNRVYSRGRYTAKVFLRIRNAEDCIKEDAAIIKITDGQSATIHARLTVATCQLNDESFTSVDLDFDLPNDEDLNFHVRSTGKRVLLLDKIEVVKH